MSLFLGWALLFKLGAVNAINPFSKLFHPRKSGIYEPNKNGATFLKEFRIDGANKFVKLVLSIFLITTLIKEISEYGRNCTLMSSGPFQPQNQELATETMIVQQSSDSCEHSATNNYSDHNETMIYQPASSCDAQSGVVSNAYAPTKNNNSESMPMATQSRIFYFSFSKENSEAVESGVKSAFRLLRIFPEMCQIMLEYKKLSSFPPLANSVPTTSEFDGNNNAKNNSSHEKKRKPKSLLDDSSDYSDSEDELYQPNKERRIIDRDDDPLNDEEEEFELDTISKDVPEQKLPPLSPAKIMEDFFKIKELFEGAEIEDEIIVNLSEVTEEIIVNLSEDQLRATLAKKTLIIRFHQYSKITSKKILPV